MKRIASLLVLATSLASSWGKDETPAPAGGNDWIKEINTGTPGKVPLINPCELVYTLSWNGMVRAGEAKLLLGLRDAAQPQATIAEFSGRSAGAAKKLWYYKSKAKSTLHATSLRPMRFESTEYDRKEKTETSAKFEADIVSSKETVEKRESKAAPKTKEQQFRFGKVYDLMSTVLYLRSQPLNPGDEINMVVHPFKSAYLAKFKVLGRETFSSEVGKIPAIKMDIKLSRIGDNLELKNHDKFKKATVWVSDDEFRVPLELRSEIFIGTVRASLEKRQYITQGASLDDKEN